MEVDPDSTPWEMSDDEFRVLFEEETRSPTLKSHAFRFVADSVILITCLVVLGYHLYHLYFH